MASATNPLKRKQSTQPDAAPLATNIGFRTHNSAAIDIENPLSFLQGYEHLTPCAPLRTSLHLPAFHRHILTPGEQADMRNSFEEMKEVLTSGLAFSDVQAGFKDAILTKRSHGDQIAKMLTLGAAKGGKGKSREKAANHSGPTTESLRQEATAHDYHESLQALSSVDNTIVSLPVAPKMVTFAPVVEELDEEDDYNGGRARKKAKVTDPAYRYTKPDREQEAADDALRPDFNDIDPAKPGKIVDPTFKPQAEDEEIESPVKATKKRKSTPKKGGRKNLATMSIQGVQGMGTPVNTPVAGPSETSTPAKTNASATKKATPKFAISKNADTASESPGTTKATKTKKTPVKRTAAKDKSVQDTAEDELSNEPAAGNKAAPTKKTLAKKATYRPAINKVPAGSKAGEKAPKTETAVKQPVKDKVVKPGKKTPVKKGSAAKVNAEETTLQLRRSPRVKKE